MDDILLVDDDEQLRESFENLLTMEGYRVKAVSSGEEALSVLEKYLPDAIIMDVRMPGLDGLSTLKKMRQKDLRLPVIIMTAYSTTDAAIEATKLGAFDYVLKPFEIPDVLELLEKALEASRMMRNKVSLKDAPDLEGGDALIGSSRAMQEVYKAIGRVAPTDAVVLLRGDSGTGKELVARAIYQHSLRVNAPFTVVNCVAIPDTLLESELFGYEKGAFTGAVSQRIGKIEQASGGTVFLDEIGDMPVAIQAKLLRLLQENQIERLGGGEPIDVDVRIIAATNMDLEEAVAENRFREDLYYRLNVITLHLPALRERLDDIPNLTKHFMRELASEMRINIPHIAESALKELKNYPWPGNVRELRNMVQKLLVFNRGEEISPEDILRFLGEKSTALFEEDEIISTTGLDIFVRRELEQNPGPNTFENLMNMMGGLIVGQALDICDGNRSQAARILGLSRPTLLARMEKYGIQ